MKPAGRSFLLFISILGSSLTSCSDKSTKPEVHTSTFPLKVGNRWTYRETLYIIPFNVPSLADTNINSITRHVVGMDTLADSAQTFIIDDSTFYSHPGTPFVNRYWYAVDDSSLKMYGIGSNSDRIWYETFFGIPMTCLDFPISIGKSWAYITPNFTHVWNVEESSELYLVGRRFQCDLVSKTTVVSGDTSELTYDEWYSNEGLIYSIQEYNRIRIHDSTWVLLDSARVVAERELTGISLLP